MKRSAEFSADRVYRYLLERHWGHMSLLQYAATRVLTVCMVNPSDAGEEDDDPTVRWLIGYGQKNDYTGLRVVNFSAFVNSSIKEMLASSDPHGPENLSYLRRYCQGPTLCAWGTMAKKLPRYDEMLAAITGPRLCLMTTRDGSPGHPLRKSHSLELKPWSEAA